MNEKDNVLISVIIPAYNAEPFISEAISSVLCQTEQRIEIIIINDGSVDNTLSIAKRFKDPRIRLEENKYNMGASYSRNKGIKLAKGEYVAFLDADDYYLPNRLEYLREHAKKHQADMVADNIYIIDKDKCFFNVNKEMVKRAGGWESIPRLFKDEKLEIMIGAVEFVKHKLPGGNDPRLGLVKPLIRKDFLIQNQSFYGEDYFLGEDYIFYLTCLVKGARFLLLGKPYYCYRYHPRQKSKPSLMNYVIRIKSNANFIKDYCKEGTELWYLLKKRNLSLIRDLYFYKAQHHLRNKKYKEFLKMSLASPFLFLIYLAKKGKGLLKRYAQKRLNSYMAI